MKKVSLSLLAVESPDSQVLKAELVDANIQSLVSPSGRSFIFNLGMLRISTGASRFGSIIAPRFANLFFCGAAAPIAKKNGQSLIKEAPSRRRSVWLW